jgi:hypothetical protein
VRYLIFSRAFIPTGITEPLFTNSRLFGSVISVGERTIFPSLLLLGLLAHQQNREGSNVQANNPKC